MDTSAAGMVVPFATGFGAEIRGMDLAREDSQATVDWIKQQLTDHAFLVFHDQNMTAEDIARFGKQMGRIERHVFEQYRHESVSEVSYVTNRDAEGNIDAYGVSRASKWHFDLSYKPELPVCTLLHALQVPKVKGGTEFADMRRAHDGMPAALRAKVEGKVSLFRVKPGGVQQESHHPTIFTHPRSGRKVLLISPQHQVGFDGLEGEDGLALMEEILEHAIQPEYYYYHQWRVGDVLIWDQLATIHRNAVDSDPNEPRIFLRTIVQ